MIRTVRSILAKSSRRKVLGVPVMWPNDPTAWVEDSGYSLDDLMTLAWEGWIVKEGAPEVRLALEKGKVSRERAKTILEARITSGWRERQATPHVQKLREAGYKDDQIETYLAMKQIAKKK